MLVVVVAEANFWRTSCTRRILSWLNSSSFWGWGSNSTAVLLWAHAALVLVSLQCCLIVSLSVYMSITFSEGSSVKAICLTISQHFGDWSLVLHPWVKDMWGKTNNHTKEPPQLVVHTPDARVLLIWNKSALPHHHPPYWQLTKSSSSI
jgi:hypothetical protein